MNEYTSVMRISHRIKQLRAQRALTQEDLAAQAGVSLATIQRAERGQQIAAATIASLAAAFNIDAKELMAPTQDPDEPYVPLVPLQSGRQLLTLLAASSRLDFGFFELEDLELAEVIDRLERWCQPFGPERLASGVLARAKEELEGTNLLREMAAHGLVVSGGTFDLHAYDVFDDGDGMPMVMSEWDATCAVVRVSTIHDISERAYIMDKLDKYESPTKGVVFPPAPAVTIEDLLDAFGATDVQREQSKGSDR